MCISADKVCYSVGMFGALLVVVLVCFEWSLVFCVCLSTCAVSVRP